MFHFTVRLRVEISGHDSLSVLPDARLQSPNEWQIHRVVILGFRV